MKFAVRNSFRFVTLLAALAGGVRAHVGSPDVYLDAKAGPYQLFVTIRPPQVIPGVAELEVRAETAGITEIRAVPLQLSKSGSPFSPTPEALKVSADDKKFFSGQLWLMADGSSQVRLLVTGDKGPGVLSVPVPSLALTTRKMDWQLGVVLSVVGIFLIGGLIAIFGAAVREAKLPAGAAPDPLKTRRGRVAMGLTFLVIGAVLWGGKSWWDAEAQVYRDRVYKPLNMSVSLDAANLATLNLDISEPGWMQAAPRGTLTRILFVRKIDDLTPDHDHLMHLYAIRRPGFDVIYHLHPELVNPAKFRLTLPAMPPGNYNLYADIVHENGLPETLTATLKLPDGLAGKTTRPLAGDDAMAVAKPVSTKTPDDTFTLPDGYRMIWLRDGDQKISSRQGMQFRFRLVTPAGQEPRDMAFYMGMLGHAAFVKTDGSVFAHIHPNGTAPMAALALAQRETGSASEMSGMHHGGMPMESNLPNEVSFPYGFPTAGSYRIFVQMKHGQTVETGVFDATVY